MGSVIRYFNRKLLASFLFCHRENLAKWSFSDFLDGLKLPEENWASFFFLQNIFFFPFWVDGHQWEWSWISLWLVTGRETSCWSGWDLLLSGWDLSSCFWTLFLFFLSFPNGLFWFFAFSTNRKDKKATTGFLRVSSQENEPHLRNFSI